MSVLPCYKQARIELAENVTSGERRELCSTLDFEHGREHGSTTHPLSTAIIASWLESLRLEAVRAKVKLTDLRQSELHVPTVVADYDANGTIGRTSVWASGEFDFEVLHTSTGQFAFFRHESAVDLASPKLLEAYRAFLKGMAEPEPKS
jgi:hypothetical protein